VNKVSGNAPEGCDSMEKTVTIGIDTGTSGCKVLALDENGRIAASASESYPIYRPRPGFSEQEPGDWWNAAALGLRRVLEELAGAHVAGVSLSGQMSGAVALDGHGGVVRRAMLWNDQRAVAECGELTAAAGGFDGLLALTGNRALPCHTGAKLLWLRKNEPESFSKIKTVVEPKDYVRFRLTGELGTDVSDASGSCLFDVARRRWCGELIAELGLPRDIFPEACGSAEPAGCVTAQAASLTGLAEGTPVFAGGGDAPLSTVGMGLRPGSVGVTLGTSGVVATLMGVCPPNPGGKLQIYCGNAPESWAVFGCTLSAAGSYQWLRDTLGSDDFRELDDSAQTAPAGCGGLLFLPYLTGERCPLFDPQARGAFIGLHASMSKGHLARAVLEGVCFSQRHVLETILACAPGLAADSVTVAGGGAKSPLWRQILADVFDMPVRTVYGSAEGGAFAAALIARVGCGLSDSMEEALSLAGVETETLPDPEGAAACAGQYRRYLSLYPALRGI